MRSQNGQLTILVLLLSMLGLVAGLSLASRSLSDLRQTTFVDTGTKALAAAEAGLSYALTQQSRFASLVGTRTPVRCTNEACVDTNNCSSDQVIPSSVLNFASNLAVKFQVCPVIRNALTVPNVAQDDVVQIDLTGVNRSNIKSFDVSWRKSASVEVEVVNADNSTPPNYSIRRYAYNPILPSLGNQSSNGFAKAQPGDKCALAGSSCNTGTGLGAFTNADNCTGPSEFDYCSSGGNNCALLVRIKPLYASSDISFCPRSAGASGINLNGYYEVVVTASAVDGTTKRVSADYFPAALPAVFDNAVYSGKDIKK